MSSEFSFTKENLDTYFDAGDVPVFTHSQYKFLTEFAICLTARYIPSECDMLAVARAI